MEKKYKSYDSQAVTQKMFLMSIAQGDQWVATLEEKAKGNPL